MSIGESISNAIFLSYYDGLGESYSRGFRRFLNLEGRLERRLQLKAEYSG